MCGSTVVVLACSVPAVSWYVDVSVVCDASVVCYGDCVLVEVDATAVTGGDGPTS